MSQGFMGRACVAVLFLTTFYEEYSHWESVQGGATTARMAPNIFEVRRSIEHQVALVYPQLEGFKLPEFEDKHLVLAMMGLQAAGSVLYLLNLGLGARLLMLYLLLSTPIHCLPAIQATPAALHHAFTGEQFSHVLKNFALFGFFMNYLSMKRKIAAARKAKSQGQS